jgi:DNA-binding YbaB/EbfC family protein
MSNPFDAMGGMQGLMGMFGNLQQKMEEMKKKAATTEVIGTAGGGMVTVKMTAGLEVLAVEIKPEAMGDREMLEDLVRAAIGDATQKARDTMAKALSDLTGGLPIPPGMLPGF